MNKERVDGKVCLGLDMAGLNANPDSTEKFDPPRADGKKN